jgi:hypothetical protein
MTTATAADPGQPRPLVAPATAGEDERDIFDYSAPPWTRTARIRERRTAPFTSYGKLDVNLVNQFFDFEPQEVQITREQEFCVESLKFLP